MGRAGSCVLHDRFPATLIIFELRGERGCQKRTQVIASTAIFVQKTREISPLANG
jgi:hypothetical protein